MPASIRGSAATAAPAPHATARRPAARSHVSSRRVAIVVVAGLVLAGAAFFVARPDRPSAHTFHVRGQPTGIAADGGLVWVASPGAGVVWVLDGDGRPAARPMPTGGTPARIALGPHWAWVADTERGAVVGLPRASGRAARRIPAGSDVADVAVGGGKVWTVSSADGGVRVIDGRRARVVADGVRPMALAADGRHVVAVDAGAGTLLRLRPAGAPLRLGGTPVDVAIAGNSAWVADAAAGTVRRVDLAGRVPPGPPIHVGHAPVAIAADTRAVYVLCRDDRTLVRIDPASGKVHEQLALRGQPAALALTPAHVWIAAGADEVIRVDR